MAATDGRDRDEHPANRCSTTSCWARASWAASNSPTRKVSRTQDIECVQIPLGQTIATRTNAPGQATRRPDAGGRMQDQTLSLGSLRERPLGLRRDRCAASIEHHVPRPVHPPGPVDRLRLRPARCGGGGVRRPQPLSPPSSMPRADVCPAGFQPKLVDYVTARWTPGHLAGAAHPGREPRPLHGRGGPALPRSGQRTATPLMGP